MTDLNKPYNTYGSESTNKDNELLENVDFQRFIYVIRNNLFLLTLLIAFCISSSFLYLRYTKEIFESKSTLKLDLKQDATEIGLSQKLSKNGSGFNHLFGEIEMLKSKIIYNEVLEEIDLATTYHFYGNILTEERYKNNPFKVLYNSQDKILFDQPINITFISENEVGVSLINGNEKTYAFNAPISISGFSFTVHKTDFFNSNQIGDKYYFVINSYGALIQYLDQNLTVDILSQKANTISVTFKDHNPSKCKDIAKTINDVYLRKTIEKKQQVQDQTLSYLNEQLDSTEKKLARSEADIEQFIRESETPDPNGDFARIAEKIDEVDSKRSELSEQIELIEDFIIILSDSAEIKKRVSSLDIINNEDLSQSVRDLNDKYKSLSILIMHSKPNTLAYKKMVAEIDYISNQVLSQLLEMKKILLKQLLIVENELSNYRKAFFGLPAKNTELTRLKRLYGLYEKFYVHLLEKKVEFGILKAGTTPEFVILSNPTLPNTPISPNKFTVYAIGIIGGFLLSILLIIVKYTLQNTIINLHDIERLVQVPILGSIPKFTGRQMDVSSLVVGDNPKSAIVEAIRSIRTNIDFLSYNKKTKVISVTSTVSGEGKTFVAINLGGVISMSGKKVIILDLDLRKPKVHLGFGGENTSGMSDILVGKSKLKDSIRHSDLNNLDYISAGIIPPNPAELIMSPAFDQVIEQLKEIYDVIFIDTPPVGLVTDGMLIMKDADVSLYVVRASYSKRGVEKNIRKLQLSKQYKHLSVILNSVEQKNSYGNYGYGYGYYEEEEKTGFFNSLKSKLNK